MADRHAPSSRILAGGVSKTRPGMASSTSHGVRRNLFQGQLTRRPTGISTTSEDEELHLDADAQNEHHHHHHHRHQHHQHNHHGGQFQGHHAEAAPFPQDDIVVRDHNGEIELGDPPTLPLDEAEDMEAQEARRQDEKERQRLAEAIRQHQIGQHSVPAQPEGRHPFLPEAVTVVVGRGTFFARHMPRELLEAVKTSLRAKVAALDEDSWLYEPGQPSQLHH
ncbi:hypothetical protein C8A05DRAFT_41729 [Staphylotrichum tortipilum]|uniref:Uncharacterized protein n=1 Tax=Staphylotrichum tortipilum TaxID=2831512 RepID=A0AAN6MQQ0_9PEZI|nr:hypothetical protein C8A05DRAFT_41729 [Staphylotrichum longicolle]